MKKLQVVLCWLFCLLFTHAAAAANYTLQHRNGVVTITSNFGSWTGYIATPSGVLQPPGTTTHYLQFDFYTPDYFQPYNGGHFAIGIRGDGSTPVGDYGIVLRGRGIILGNVTGYPIRTDPCGPTTQVNTIAIESFWAASNCVFPTTEGPALRNHQRYRVLIECAANQTRGPLLRTRYQLWAQNAGGGWDLVGQNMAFDHVLNDTPHHLGGWFIAEVLSRHEWTFEITNLQSWWQ